MPTPAEKKALIFFATVACLGGAARVIRAGSAPPPPPMSQPALERQLYAVDSARKVGKRRGKGGSRKRGTPRADSFAGIARAPASTPALPVISAAPAGPGARLGRSGSRLDLDVASEAELEELPGIGPVLAGRILADRTARGGFGSLAALRSVRGVGPRLAARLEPLVTFSAAPRPLDAVPGSASDSFGRRPRRKRSRP